MKRYFVGLFAGVVTLTSLVLAQDMPQQQKPLDPEGAQKKPDVVLMGCVTQGSGPGVFILDNARTDAKDKTEKGRTYLLVNAAEDLNLASAVNHEVSVTGAVEQQIAPAQIAPGQKADEKTLPKFTAKSITNIADTCAAAE